MNAFQKSTLVLALAVAAATGIGHSPPAQAASSEAVWTSFWFFFPRPPFLPPAMPSPGPGWVPGPHCSQGRPC